MRATETARWDDEAEADNADWAIPADRVNGGELDPWTAMIEELADEAEHPYQYPAGLP
jgi:hypothetical protein